MIFFSRALALSITVSIMPVLPAAAETFTIAGTIVNHATGQPLKNAFVSIASVAQRDRPSTCVTSDDGRFVFNNLGAGKYTLSATRRGYAGQGFQADDNYSTAIAVGPGLDSEHIVFPLTASGSLSGTVFDEEGDPVRQAQVLLFFKSVLSGKSRIVMRGSQSTGSAGEFQFAHVPPGTYFVGVQGRPWYANNQPTPIPSPDGQESTKNSELDVVYPVTYYGDVTDPASPSPIAIAEGSSVDIQISLRPVPALHVRLSGIEVNQGGGVSATTIQKGPGGYPIRYGGGVARLGNGWEVTGLAPGQYDLALHRSQNGKQEVLGAKTVRLTGDSSLDMSEVSKATVSGRIVFEGSESPARAAVSLFRLGQGWRAPVQPDGTFALGVNNVLPGGHYAIQLQGAPGYYLKSISAKGAKFSGGELEMPDGTSAQLSLVAARGLKQIEGVSLKDDQPFSGAMVLLLPQDLNRTDLIRRDQSDSDGTFSLNDVVPGRYTLLAIDNSRGLEYEEPEIIKPYLSQGQVVQIPMTGDSKLRVTVSPRH